MRRYQHHWAGLALALFSLTCTDRAPTGPGRLGAASFDLTALLTAPGDPPVPADSVRISVRRANEEFPFYHDTVAITGLAAAGDSATITLSIPMQQSTEDVVVTVAVVGSGVTWYTGTSTATLTAGATVNPSSPLILTYVGLGFDADSVRITMTSTRIVGGFPVTVGGAVWVPGGILSGVPVGFRVADSSVATITQVTVGGARITGRVPVRDSTWVYAETPTHLKDSVRVFVVPPPAQLQKQSGDNQTGAVGAPLPQPLCVVVLDGLGAPVAGITVTWAPGTGSAGLSTTASVSDLLGVACVLATPQSLGAATVVATSGTLTPVTFAFTVQSGAIRQVILTPAGPDTIARTATLQYSASLRDSLGNTVSGTVNWSSSVPTVASVTPTGLATGLAGDSTRIIATAGGYADSAWLFVRALRSVAVRPADTVITAVNDSLTLTAAALDNFGDTVVTGVVLRYLTATPTVAAIVNSVTGRVRIVGPGNAVVVARDSVSGVQGTATLRVVQTPASVVNTQDSIQVGVGGRGQVVAQVLDRKGFAIPGRTLGWQTRATAIATVDQTGMVTGVALGPTYVVDSLVDGASVFKDSTLISVVPTPPALIQWAFDSTAVGNGGNLSVALSLTRPPVGAPLIVKLTSSDSMFARPTVKAVTIPQGQSGTSVTINGLVGGTRVTLVAQDSSGLGYLPDTMVVTVVSTIEFREIGTFSRQPNFYVNNNQTHRAQVFLSDPAPAGGLGVTFVYGVPGKSLLTPSPAIIPAGQLAADVVITGLAPGRDSVIPTSGGFVGRHSIVNVAPESLQFVQAYPYTGVVGLGQTYEPYVQITYAMDHPLTVAVNASPALLSRPDTVILPAGTTYRYITIAGAALGNGTVTVSAPGWISGSLPFRVSTPRLQAYSVGSMVAGDPTHGYWYAYSADSLDYNHDVVDTVTVTAVSRNPTVVAVDSALGKILPGLGYVTVNDALRALPGAGGDSTWIVLTAPGYTPDSALVYVQRPTLTFVIGYPYTGRVPHGTLHQSAGYVQIPYARSDTFWVVLGHTNRGVLGGPDSVAILPGTTYTYFDVRGESLGVDTVSVQRAAGYVVSGAPIGFRVDRPRVALSTYPTTLYTISAPTYVTAAVMDSLYGYQHPLLAPLTVSLVSRNPSAFTLDSATVVIPAGTSISTRDTLRVVGVDSAGSRIVASAASAASDSSPLIRVLPTPLNVSIGYPYTLARGLTLPGSRVYLTGGNAPDTIRVALAHTNSAAFSLSADTVVIPRGQSQSVPFAITGLDSVGTDSIIASALNYVTGRGTLATQPARLDVQEPGANQLTTNPPQRLITSTMTRNGYALNPATPVSFTIVSSNPNVIQIDSAAFVNTTFDTATSTVPSSLYYGYFKIRYVGSGTARLYVSAPGFDRDSTQLVTVTGPTLRVSYPTITVGQGQVYTTQRVYVDNAVTSPLVVDLLRSDSTLPPANQAFSLAATSVTIPVGQTYSPYFDITGNVPGTAQLIARATGYSQAVSTIQVGAPQLEVSTATVTLYVGERPRNVTIYTEDQAGQQQYVAVPLVVSSVSSDPTIARSDSATRTIAARSSSTFFPIKPLRKGSVAVVFSAPGYKSDTTVVTVDTAKLTLSASVAPGPGQQAVNGMSVSLPYATDSLLVVSLTSTNPSVLTVPPLDTIPAANSSASFTLTGVGVGQASVIVTAPHSLPDTQVMVVGTPNLFVSLTAATNAGQQYTMTVFTRDSVGNTRPVTAPLAITLSSSNAAHTAFGTNPITVSVNGSSASSTVTFDTAGTYTITAKATGYNDGVASTTTTGALVQIVGTPAQAFVPQTVTISVGRVVTWRNVDTVIHTSTADGATPAWNSGNIVATTGQYQRTFSAAGTFPYHCTIHPSMMGTIVVQ